LSLLKLVLPDELVLKKYIVALVMALNILLCKIIDAFIQTDTNVADLMSVANIMENVNIAKTMTQICREIVHQNNILDILAVIVDVLFMFVAINIILSALFSLRKTCSSKLTLKTSIKKKKNDN